MWRYRKGIGKNYIRDFLVRELFSTYSTISFGPLIIIIIISI